MNEPVEDRLRSSLRSVAEKVTVRPDWAGVVDAASADSRGHRRHLVAAAVVAILAVATGALALVASRSDRSGTVEVGGRGQDGGAQPGTGLFLPTWLPEGYVIAFPELAVDRVPTSGWTLFAAAAGQRPITISMEPTSLTREDAITPNPSIESSRLTVRGRPAVVARVGAAPTVSWIERDGVLLSVSAPVGESETLVEIAEGLREVDVDEWNAFLAELDPTVTTTVPVGDVAAFCATSKLQEVSGPAPITAEFAEQFRPILDVAPPELRALLEAWLADPTNDDRFGAVLAETVRLCGAPPSGPTTPPDGPGRTFCALSIEWVPPDGTVRDTWNDVLESYVPESYVADFQVWRSDPDNETSIRRLTELCIPWVVGAGREPSPNDCLALDGIRTVVATDPDYLFSPTWRDDLLALAALVPNDLAPDVRALADVTAASFTNDGSAVETVLRLQDRCGLLLGAGS